MLRVEHILYMSVIDFRCQCTKPPNGEDEGFGSFLTPFDVCTVTQKNPVTMIKYLRVTKIDIRLPMRALQKHRTMNHAPIRGERV